MSAPVKHTCPDIDKVIGRIQSALNAADKGKDITERKTPEWYLFDEITDHLYRMEDSLEELRTANGALRDWGYDLEREIKEAENNQANTEKELQKAESDRRDLELEIADFKKELKDLESILNSIA